MLPKVTIRNMVAAVKQFVTVQAGGVIRIRSKELQAGDEAEVIVLVPERAARANRKPTGRKRAERSDGVFPVARRTKQVRGDIAQANRARKAIREGREQLIPWEQAKRELERR